MGYDLRQVTISGRIVRDAETKDTSRGSVTVVTVACGYASGSGGNRQEGTDYWRVSLWGDSQSGVVPYLRKGQAVIVTGDPRINTYEKRDGTTGVDLSIHYPRIVLVGGKPDATSAERGNGHAANYNDNRETEEEIPF